jgi:hypothetical protein
LLYARLCLREHVRTGPTPATSAPGLGPCLPHLRQDRASPVPHLRRDLRGRWSDDRPGRELFGGKVRARCRDRNGALTETATENWPPAVAEGSRRGRLRRARWPLAPRPLLPRRRRRPRVRQSVPVRWIWVAAPWGGLPSGSPLASRIAASARASASGRHSGAPRHRGKRRGPSPRGSRTPAALRLYALPSLPPPPPDLLA